MFLDTDKVLFNFAHPDDESISAGGLMYKLLKKKIDVHVKWFTISDIRKLELSNALNLIQERSKHNFASIDFYDFPDTKLTDYKYEIKDIIEKSILKNGITHSISHCADTHPDHIALKEANEIAGRCISTFEFETPNAYNFNPSFFVELTEEEVQMKLDMMKCHVSQNQRNHNFYLDKIMAISKFRGLACYTDYAEAYFPKRIKI